MPQYDLHVLCSECGEFHDMLLRVSLEESFEVRNVGDIYDGENQLEFYQAVSEQKCAVTGKPIRKPTTGRMILVRVGWLPKK